MIYFDMDGVLADFDRYIEDAYGVADHRKSISDFFKSTCVNDRAFEKMQPIPEGIELLKTVESIVPDQICICTSTGGLPHHIEIAKQKLNWLRAHDLGHLPVAFAMNTENKGQYAQPNAILVDDRPKVIAAWKRNGGDGIHFTRDRERISAMADYIYLSSLDKEKHGEFKPEVEKLLNEIDTFLAQFEYKQGMHVEFRERVGETRKKIGV